MFPLLRPLLFRLDPERAHRISLGLLRGTGELALARACLRSVYCVEHASLVTEAFGVRFPNPVGLAAGYDKDGVALRGLAALGFGHIEIGTVTLRPQPGNPTPRIHRFPAQRALVNSMGFPNAGLEAMRVELLRASMWTSRKARIGINIGKGRDTPLEEAAEEYVVMLERVHEHADYVVLNVSSPNTPGLRRLQDKSFLRQLLGSVCSRRDSLARRVPLLVKIAPDLEPAQLDDVLEAIEHTGVDGLIATNTTLEREGLPGAAANLPGGTSGEPLRHTSTEIIRYAAQRTEGRLPIIGVGGIATAEDAIEKLQAGAHMVQVYTGLVYQGPAIARRINRGLIAFCQREGLRSLAELPRGE